jgi:hypothetical protein
MREKFIELSGIYIPPSTPWAIYLFAFTTIPNFAVDLLRNVDHSVPCQSMSKTHQTSSWEMSVFSGTGVRWDMSRTERKIRMQHDLIQQKEQRCALQEDKQQFIEEIAALRSLAELAGITGHLLEDLDDFKHDIEYLDASSWERKQVQVLNRNTLERFSVAVLRAYRIQSC